MPKIHASALVSPEAHLADDVIIGPFAVIEGPVKLSAGVEIGGHSWITGRTEVGEGTRIGWGSVIGADPQDLSFDPSTESGVRIGSNNTLREYVTIHRGSKPGSDTRVGDGNFLMTGVHLAHDVMMGDGNVLANNVLIAGHVRIGSRTFLGGGSAFHQFIHIGDFALVQGNSAVSQDLPPYCALYGINRLAGLNVVGLRRAGFSAEERAEIKRAYHLVFASGKRREEALEEASQRSWGRAAANFLEAVAHPSKKGVAAP